MIVKEYVLGKLKFVTDCNITMTLGKQIYASYTGGNLSHFSIDLA